MRKVLRPLVSLCIGSLIFIGIPAASWGLGDLRGFFAEPARALYVGLVFVLMAVAVFVVPDTQRSRRPGTALVKRQHIALVIMQVLSLAIVAASPYCDRRGIATLADLPAIRYLGLVLFTLGYLIMNWAVMALGRQFSVEVTVQENHQLITTGLYRHIRHPRYLGVLLFLVGIALIFRSWLGLLLAALMLLVLIWRIRDEELLLHQQFGSQWEQYARTTRRMIPGVY